MEKQKAGVVSAEKSERSGWSIGEIRHSIDEIDSEIVSLINKRLGLGKKIGTIKKRNGFDVVDDHREVEIRQRLARVNSGPLDDSDLHHIFNQIISATRKVQR